MQPVGIPTGDGIIGEGKQDTGEKSPGFLVLSGKVRIYCVFEVALCLPLEIPHRLFVIVVDLEEKRGSCTHLDAVDGPKVPGNRV